MADKETLQRILKRGVAEVIVEENLLALLKAGQPLRLKMGFDPSSPDIHLGHTVGLRKLRQLQELGHQVILIVGDWTAMIGDPSGRTVTRPMLTREQVNDNAQTYLRQFFKIVDKERTQVMWQSEWFGKFTLTDVFNLTGRFTVAQFLAREDFAKRFKEQRPIAITEFLYPLLQAYDSVMIKADVEFGGTDQKFNLLVGRELQEMMGQKPQQCLLVPILVGTDGVQKMSKSLGNYIGVEEPPQDMFGKLMSIPDSLIMDYVELMTSVSDAEVRELRKGLEKQSVNPMQVKKRLAHDVVAQLHSVEAAREAQTTFERVVQKKEAPEDIREVCFGSADEIGKLRIWWADKNGDRQEKVVSLNDIASASILHESGVTPMKGSRWLISVDMTRLLPLLELVSSRGEAKKLVDQGAVRINNVKLSKYETDLEYGVIVQVGKRRFVRIVNSD